MNKLALVLGFRKTCYWKVGDYTFESVFNVETVNAIYVYCNVIEYRSVGYTLAPLIGVLPVTRKPGAYVSKGTTNTIHPVLKKNFSDIYISLCDDEAKQIRFCKGKVMVTLHSRPRKLNSL